MPLLHADAHSRPAPATLAGPLLGMWALWCGLACTLSAQAQAQAQAQKVQRAPTYSIDTRLDFRPGPPELRKLTQRLKDAEFSELVAGRFDLAAADLNGDGSLELVLRGADSGACGNAGCTTLVIEQRPDKTIVVLLKGFFPQADIAITRESVNGFRALASVDDSGTGIRRTEPANVARYGPQVVQTLSRGTR